MNNGKVPLVPQRLKRRQGRMQTEEAIEVNHLLPGNIDAGPHRVIRLFAMRHHDVQAVGCTALKDYHQPSVVGAGFSRAPCCSRQEGRDRRGADYGHRAALQECPSCNAHGLLIHLRWNSGEPSNNPAITLTLVGCEGSSNCAIACGPTMRSSIVWCVCLETSPGTRACSSFNCT